MLRVLSINAIGNSMAENPNGPYPGRQLFIGLTEDCRPALAYLVTGRSAPSRERKAVLTENGKGVIIGPIGDAEYDPLRHYTAIKVDDKTGLGVVSNGIQTDAIFEMYKLLANVDTPAKSNYLKTILTAAKAEPDSLNTPRIAGVIAEADQRPKFYIGIKKEANDQTRALNSQPEKLVGVSTYNGDMDNPEPYNIFSEYPEIQFNGKNPRELAEYLFDISEATNDKGEDIRVCSIGGVYYDESRLWDLSIKNRHE